MAEIVRRRPAGPLVARSPVRQAPPVERSEGWEVSARRSLAPLRLADASPLAKALVRAPVDEPLLGVPFGRARRQEADASPDGDGALVVGSRPGEWTVIGAPEPAWALAERAADDVVDLTHGLALLRLTGAEARAVLATLCAIDLSDPAAPDATALTSSVAKVVAEIVRDDVSGEPSYLLACDRSYGQYLFDEVREAGARHGLDVDGFPGWR